MLRQLCRARGKHQGIFKGKYTRLTADFSEDLHARRLWNDVFWVPKHDNCQPRLLHLARFSFIAGEVKTFCDKDK